MTGGETVVLLVIAGGLLGTAWAKARQNSAGGRLKPGQRVYHRKHGYGQVEGIRRAPGRYAGGYYTHATVKFEDGRRLDIPADQLTLR